MMNSSHRLRSGSTSGIGGGGSTWQGLDRFASSLGICPVDGVFEHPDNAIISSANNINHPITIDRAYLHLPGTAGFLSNIATPLIMPGLVFDPIPVLLGVLQFGFETSQIRRSPAPALDGPACAEANPGDNQAPNAVDPGRNDHRRPGAHNSK